MAWGVHVSKAPYHTRFNTGRKPGLYYDHYCFQDMILLIWLVNSFAVNLLNLLVAFCAAYAEYTAPH